MEILITDYALSSYLDLKLYFSDEEYWNVIRPKAEKLKGFPDDEIFDNPKFWGPAKDRKGIIKNL